MTLAINWGAGFITGPIERLRINPDDGINIADNGIFFIVIRKEEERGPENCLVVKVGYNNNNFIIKISSLLLQNLKSTITKEIIILMPDGKDKDYKPEPEIVMVPYGTKERRKK